MPPPLSLPVRCVIRHSHSDCPAQDSYRASSLPHIIPPPAPLTFLPLPTSHRTRRRRAPVFVTAGFLPLPPPSRPPPSTCLSRGGHLAVSCRSSLFKRWRRAGRARPAVAPTVISPIISTICDVWASGGAPCDDGTACALSDEER